MGDNSVDVVAVRLETCFCVIIRDMDTLLRDSTGLHVSENTPSETTVILNGRYIIINYSNNYPCHRPRALIRVAAEGCSGCRDPEL